MAQGLERTALIPRYQRALFWILLCASAVMAIFLIRLRERAEDRLQIVADTAPLLAPAQTPPTDVTLMLANDNDGSLVAEQLRLSLPDEATTRARFLLNQLLAEYAKPGSAHPIAQNAGVDTVFLMPEPSTPKNVAAANKPGMVAIVNLSAGLAQAHPSGIEPETMTLLSIIGTLHANLPAIAEVRFLVDGQPRDTLAGHADLTRTYLASSSAGPVPETSPTQAATPNVPMTAPATGAHP